MDESMEQFPEVESTKTPTQDGAPYFMGEQALVRFSDGVGGSQSQNYWLVDKNNKTVRPFESDNSLKITFGEGYNDAIKNSMMLSTPSVNENSEITEGVLQDFAVLDPKYTIKNDGSSKRLRVSPSQLKKRYGKPIDENAEGLASEALDGLFNILKSKDDKIPNSFIEQIKKDTQLMAYYISALAYGQYSLSNVYADIAKLYKEE